MSKRVCLGKIASAHGVKGLVKILPYGEDPALITDLGPAYRGETSDETLVVTIKSSAGKTMLASVDGVIERNGAEAIRGTELWYDRALLPDIKDDDDSGYYFDDMVGLNVLEDGAEIGLVTEVNNFGASDLIEISPKGGTPYYFPFTDETIANVDVDAGTIEVIGSADYKDV